MALADIDACAGSDRARKRGALAPRRSLETLAGIFTGFRIVPLSIIEQGIEFVNIGKRLAEVGIGMIGPGASSTDDIDAVCLAIVLTDREVGGT